MKINVLVFLSFIYLLKAEYIYDVKKYNQNDSSVIEIKCEFQSNSIGSTKYYHFLTNSTYTHNVFTCENTDVGKKCFSDVNEKISCNSTGYEGQFCHNYGGKDKLVYCKE